jgi:uncharacterized protein YecA (UPF0149 family)
MKQEAFKPNPRVLERLKILVAEKKREQARKAAPVTHQPVVAGAKVGRNDPCPCGSGKKYKKCHLLIDG